MRRIRSAGFTLIELMIVVGIIGIVAAMTNVALPRMQLDQRIARASRVFASSVREARGYSLANRAYTRITVDASVPSIVLEYTKCDFEAANSSAASCGSWNQIAEHRLNRGEFRMVGVTLPGGAGCGPPAIIIFGPSGLIESACSGVYLFNKINAADTAQQWWAQVSPQGLVTVN